MSSFSGMVMKTTGSWHWVRTAGGDFIACKLKGNFRMRGIRTTNPVAVGDLVEGFQNQGEKTGFITVLHPRRNYIIRKATKLSSEAHILAANVDQAFLMVTMTSPVTHSMFADRFLVSAEAYRVPVSLLFNKMDLYGERQLDELAVWLDAYEIAGYPCHLISLLDQEAILRMAELLKGKTTVLAGNSGVGKTTLINSLVPDLKLRTAQISDYHKTGRHTTTFPEMVELPGGGMVIDTPGIRGFGVIDIDKNELYHFFPEIFTRSATCQFHNCTHTHEPGCAVKKATESGEISGMRYENYLSMMESGGHKYRQGY